MLRFSLVLTKNNTIEKGSIFLDSMVDSAIVARTLNADFIWLDLIFLTIWITTLARKKYWIPIAWGILGWWVYVFTDYYIWYTVMESRHYIGPFNDVLFFQWFCFSPGFVQFSYVAVMFEKRNLREILLWTGIFYLGWTLVGVGSQLLPIDDRIIQVWRDMNADSQRVTFTIMTIINVVIAVLLWQAKKIRLEDVGYLFLIGTLVEFCLEFSLAVSGIRMQQGTWSPTLMLVNTLIEFNMGIVLMFLIWFPFKIKRDGKGLSWLHWEDLRVIQTDFNAIAVIAANNPRSQSRREILERLYPKAAIEKDLHYYQEKQKNN
jgi:hypothetical protein